MAEYSGSVTLISGITPKNGGTFPLVNAPDVLVDADTDQRLDEALSSLKSAGIAYGVCGDAQSVTAKTVDIDGFALTDGATVIVKFTYGIAAGINFTLNVNDEGGFAVSPNNIDGWQDMDYAVEKNGMLMLTYDAATGFFVVSNYFGNTAFVLNEIEAYAKSAGFGDMVEAMTCLEDLYSEYGSTSTATNAETSEMLGEIFV